MWFGLAHEAYRKVIEITSLFCLVMKVLVKLASSFLKITDDFNDEEMMIM